ncbi:eukaryotic elongation factor, selenocysteine-tRNA-specific [Polychytrium aggregatum]|uniref:eukaryotic elongation factor, selenocysteine-tRNA-specific n=1 Tax=Polychytrium aggregatum TaxID=110093 RepID=UPI0022FEF195|nr:eukaryotic elongation factor, selenocysteine-tRNA-specific [Polychytrium aggregatum]KAI9208924.1 eukaryotic elongation factor, selenocysteine-tRNA-specific [Polychytrium aggregatum]
MPDMGPWGLGLDQTAAGSAVGRSKPASEPPHTGRAGMPATACNINIGLLGHVDAGKTALAYALTFGTYCGQPSLAPVTSTAAFDKHPESKARGITLDLGFSAFQVPKELVSPEFEAAGISKVQITLVDCPGHASLVKTVLGGAQIIDAMILVIDAAKGFQTQTSECLIIAEITRKTIIVALNKVDLFPEAEREARISKMSQRITKTLEAAGFPNVPIIPVCTKPLEPTAKLTQDADPTGTSDGVQTTASSAGGDGWYECNARWMNIEALLRGVMDSVCVPRRSTQKPFLCMVDHCFAIKGQGTVLTGTVLEGSTKVGDVIEIVSLSENRKIKSMQSFKKPVTTVAQGDRVGICVTKLEPSLVERGMLAAPGSVIFAHAALATAKRIRYFKPEIASKTKIHVTIGHETALATITFLKALTPIEDDFDFQQEYQYEPLLPDHREAPGQTTNRYSVLLEFDKPIACPKNSLFITSKLDDDNHAGACRIAFHGRVQHAMADPNYKEQLAKMLRVYKLKEKVGTIDRVVDERMLIGAKMFKKETNLELFVGMKVVLGSSHEGTIESGFGQSGKFRVRFATALPESLVRPAKATKNPAGRREAASGQEDDQRTLRLTFKKAVYQDRIYQ